MRIFGFDVQPDADDYTPRRRRGECNWRGSVIERCCFEQGRCSRCGRVKVSRGTEAR